MTILERLKRKAKQQGEPTPEQIAAWERLENKRRIGRTAQRRWDKKHMRTVSTKLTVEEYDAMMEILAAWGTTPYATLQKLIRAHVIGRIPD